MTTRGGVIVLGLTVWVGSSAGGVWCFEQLRYRYWRWQDDREEKRRDEMAETAELTFLSQRKRELYEKLAELRGESPEDVEADVRAKARREQMRLVPAEGRPT